MKEIFAILIIALVLIFGARAQEDPKLSAAAPQALTVQLTPEEVVAVQRYRSSQALRTNDLAVARQKVMLLASRSTDTNALATAAAALSHTVPFK